MSSFSTYMIGFVVLILGLALAAYLLNAPAVWIVVGVVIFVGIAILMATTRTKQKDPQAPPDAP
jgi:positive regulator of sigma E activity